MVSFEVFLLSDKNVEENASIIEGLSSSTFVGDESFKYKHGGRRNAANVTLFSDENELK
jgi:hypothetical protein